jgi:co-chaperonin GroES (HSP10)
VNYMVDPTWKPDVAAIKANPRLPQPVNYHILVAIPPAETQTKGGIFIPQAAAEREQVGSAIGLVLRIGPAAFADHRRFPQGKPENLDEGSFVVLRPYSGNRLEFVTDDGKPIEMRFIADDAILAVVDDPRSIRRP